MVNAMVGLCQCGCGEPAPISHYNSKPRGYVKGEPRKYVQGHHMRRTLDSLILASELEHAWAAGILDGEGSIQISRQRLGHTLTVSVGQSGKAGIPAAMLVKLKSHYGGSLVPHRRVRVADDGCIRKTHHHWAVVSRDAEVFLRSVAPYVVQKRDQVELALAYRENAVGKGKFDEAACYRDLLKAAKR